LNDEAGGREGFDAMAARLHELGLGLVVDVVPNHMAVPTPAYLNRPLWSVLREGPASPYARWFDIQWAAERHALLMPMLGARIGQVLLAGELTIDAAGGPGGDETVLRYHEHEFPVRPGTAHLPLAELVERQWYRLAHWRVADDELNYRRFFDIDTLAAIRVEDPEVFAPTHALLLELVRGGAIDGLRIDHPDGLADPRGYLRHLRSAAPDAWVVVEKILEGDESLPADWPCAGTTGYDALLRLGGVFVDPAGAGPFSALLTELTGDRAGFVEVAHAAKAEVTSGLLYTEVERLTAVLADICAADVLLRDHTRRALQGAVTALLVAIGRYRAYVVVGEEPGPETVAVIDAAVARAAISVPEPDPDALALVRDLVLGRPVGSPHRVGDAARAEVVIRFQQACGPVMAKGVEDTAFYRWPRLTALNEVGGDPGRFGVSPDELHAYAARIAHDWPATMTALTTHDTKRSEDVRARLAVLSEVPGEWVTWLREVRETAIPHRDPALDPRTEYLIWQTLVGTWPIGAERLEAHAVKAVREAKDHTSWTTPVASYEAAVTAFVRGVLADPSCTAALDGWVARHTGAERCVVLGQKLLQLVLPGVPDTYQGTELVMASLVDPDNRGEADLDRPRTRLAALDAGSAPADLDDEKLLVTSRALRLRREHAGWFTGPAARTGPVAATSAHALALGRGTGGVLSVVAVVTRLAVGLDRLGGWAEHTLALPPGLWRDVLTGRQVRTAGAGARLADLLADLPVGLLVRVGR
ncbi:MAG TPA: malto-oligosyltrehalose synthase, partial [Candidatus Lustribacter sp.]|nr:malto-oligosyltrehalose synthase [Candidatus Lustribacter sp.]